jgi:hypothetical protein
MFTRMNSKRTARAGIHRAFLALAVLCYTVTAAIVPTGYMAAAVGSGTPVHLCPSDSRSALLIASLRSIHVGHGAAQHHAAHEHLSAQGMQHSQDHGADHASSGEHSSESGCPLVSPSAATAGIPAALLLSSALAPPPAPHRGHYRDREARWLRPLVRSPPA